MAKINLVKTFNKPIIDCHFYKNLKLSVKVKIEKLDQVLINFEEIMQITVHAKVIAS